MPCEKRIATDKLRVYPERCSKGRGRQRRSRVSRLVVSVQGDKSQQATKRYCRVARGTRAAHRQRSCLSVGSVTSYYLCSFLAGERSDDGPLFEVKLSSEIRPRLDDDSLTYPLAPRQCGEVFCKCSKPKPCDTGDTSFLVALMHGPLLTGNCFPMQADAVNVLKDGCWWTDKVCKCNVDHIAIMFPSEHCNVML